LIKKKKAGNKQFKKCISFQFTKADDNSLLLSTSEGFRLKNEKEVGKLIY